MRVYCTSGKIRGPLLSDRSVTFKGQTEGVKTGVAGGARRIVAMFSQQVANGQIGLGLVPRQFGNGRWRWWNHFAEHSAHHPISSFDRTGSQSRGVLGEEHSHRQQAAAIVRQ